MEDNYSVWLRHVKIAGHGVLSAVVTDCRHAEGGAIRTCPNHVRSAELLDNIVRRDCQNVGVKVDILKVLVPFNGKDLMPMGFKRFANATGSGE